MRVLRSPSLASGGEAFVVHLYEVQPFARGGLAKKPRAITLNISEPEMKQLRTTWGKPNRRRAKNVVEYAFPQNALKNLERLADGGGVGYAPTMSTPLTAPASTPTQAGRTRNPEIADYYTYGFGPEHEFFSPLPPPPPIAEATASDIAHLPTTPSGPATQSAGGSGGNLAALGSLLAGGSALASSLGYNNAITQGASTAGNLAAGNYLGAAKSGAKFYGSLTTPSIGDYASGQATNDALSQAGITGTAAPIKFDEAGNAIEPASSAAAPQSSALGSVGKALGTAGDVYGIYSGIKEGDTEGYVKAARNAAKLAGYDVPALGYVGAAQQALKGDVPGAAISAISTYLPIAGLGFAAANLANKSLNAHGDENRNLQAFLTDNPLGITSQVESGAMSRGIPPLTGYLTQDGRLLDWQYVNDLAGAYYGSAYAPDGNQSEWTQKYQDLLKSPVTFADSKWGKSGGFQWDGAKFVRADGKNIDTYINGKKVAMGGALRAAESTSERHVKGPGTGRSDSIPAQLSDGEYVLTAEDVSLLGDGSNEAGARRLDQFRQQLRKHKGGALARGKISPNAKSPMQYMRGVK